MKPRDIKGSIPRALGRLYNKSIVINRCSGRMLAIDMKTTERANALMEKMEAEGVGYLVVSHGYFKTLFSCSGKSTSSEVPKDLHFTFSYLLLPKTTCVLLQSGHLRFSQEHRTAIN